MCRETFTLLFNTLILSLSTRELGIGIVPYSPVGRGLFAGKAVVESLPANSFLVRKQTVVYFTLNSFDVSLLWSNIFCIKSIFPALMILDSFTLYQTAHPRFTGENFEKNKSIYFRMEGIAKKHGCSPAQLAISWVLHQGDDIVPIPGKQFFS